MPSPLRRSIRVTPFANARIESIREWYDENYGEEMGHDFYDIVLEKLMLLEDFNEIGPEVSDRPEIRRLVILGRFPYYLFYRLTETAIIVLTLNKDANHWMED